MTNEELKIREVLFNGEEAVSPHVWEGVVKGLDKAAAGAAVGAGAAGGRIVRFRWWGAVAAFAAVAAAVALVVLLPGRSGGNPSVNPGTVAVVEDPSLTPGIVPEIGSEEVSAAEQGDIAPEVASKNVSGAKQGVFAPEVASEDVPGAEQGDIAPEVAPEDVSGANQGDIAPEVASEDASGAKQGDSAPESGRTNVPSANQGGYTPRQDPFAALIAQMEKPELPKLAAITFGGVTQVGGSRPAGPGPGSVFAAPPLKVTGIKENGQENFSMPISFGVSFRYPIVSGLSIGAGINYTMLGRTFAGTYTEVENGVLTRVVADAHIREKQHYIGIPVNLYYDVVSSPRFSASIFGGAMVERCLKHSYRIPNSEGDINYEEKPSGLQPSVAAGIGLQYNVLPSIGIYAEPGVHYYFDAHQPRSIRTMQPWMVSMELGVRYNFGK